MPAGQRQHLCAPEPRLPQPHLPLLSPSQPAASPPAQGLVSPPAAPAALQLGRFELRVQERLLLDAGQPVALAARGLDVLIALVSARGALVSKDSLLQAAWPGLVVEEANVHVQVSNLRKLLGKAAIATVGGLGYRWALPAGEATLGVGGSGAPGGQVLPTPPTGGPPALHAGGSPSLQSGVAQAPPPPPAPHNLPGQASAFVGREAALDNAARQLAVSRLLTLSGIGGMGKTRLALQLARRCLPQFADGVWFADLAPVQDKSALPTVLLRALGLAAGTADALAAVLSHLQGRQLLLVLDNCEHLQTALPPLVSRLLDEAPGLSVLATSRETLQLPGERVFVVQPLQVPGPPDIERAALASATDLATAAGSEAVQLFVDRVRADLPGFALEADNAAWVVDICRRLDGIPLALELAAARIKMLSVRQLHGLLAQRFALLTKGAQSLPRQQTLLEVLRWSYEHLPAGEQTLLAAVAACAGGFDLDAACALSGHSEQPVAVLDGLAVLAERALIKVTHHADTARYGMLETVREYMLAELAATGQIANVQARHHTHFFSLARQAEQHPYGPAHAAWSKRLDGERENLLAALAWCQAQQRTQEALQMVVSLKQFWFATGLLDQGLRATESALATLDDGAQPSETTPDARAAALRLAAQLCLFMGHLPAGAAHAQQALARSEALGDEGGAAAALCFAGRISVKSGDLAAGLAWLQEGLRRARASQTLATVAEALNALAFLAIEGDDLDTAEACFTEGLQTSQRRGSELGSLIENLNLAWVAVMKSRRGAGADASAKRDPEVGADVGEDAARQRLLGVWQTLQRMPHRYVAQELVDVCASYAEHRGWFAEAVCLHEASTLQRDAIHLPLTASQAQRRAPEMVRALAALGAAGYAAAAAKGQGLGHEETLARIGNWLLQGQVAGDNG